MTVLPARRVAVSVAIATAAFTLALATRDSFNPWWATLIAAAVSLAAIAPIVRRPPRALFAITRRRAAIAAGLGVTLVVGTHVAYRIAIALWPPLEPEVVGLYQSIAVAPGPLWGAPIIAAVVFTEELVWRGVLIGALEPVARRLTVVTVAVACYAAPHAISGAWLLLGAALGLGAVCSVQRARHGSLTAPLITHGIWSLAIFTVLPLH